MKRFAVFGFDDYYPYGGMGDFMKSFDTEEQAKEFIKKLRVTMKDSAGVFIGRDNYEIADMESYE